MAYKSKALTEMADEALEMVRREKEILWKAKRLLRRFRGDVDWVPCEMFETEQDDVMLLPNNDGAPEVPAPQSAVPSVTLEQDSIPDKEAGLEDRNGDASADQADIMAGEEGIEAMDMALQQAAVEAEKTEIARTAGTETAGSDGDVPETSELETLAPSATALDNPALTGVRRSIEREREPEAASERTSNSGKEANAPSHAMTTRARARSPQITPSPSPTPSDSASVPAVHPWFQIPPSSIPDRDLGLPANEAEETRRLLLLYVQKQEQVVRQLSTLYEGLQRADRVRRDVYRACKAEGHLKDDGKGNMVTEMSDGEDWYDVEDWGLGKADLKIGKDGRLGLEKGKDEVEDAEEEGRRGGRRRRVNRM